MYWSILKTKYYFTIYFYLKFKSLGQDGEGKYAAFLSAFPQILFSL